MYVLDAPVALLPVAADDLAFIAVDTLLEVYPVFDVVDPLPAAPVETLEAPVPPIL